MSVKSLGFGERHARDLGRIEVWALGIGTLVWSTIAVAASAVVFAFPVVVRHALGDALGTGPRMLTLSATLLGVAGAAAAVALAIPRPRRLRILRLCLSGVAGAFVALAFATTTAVVVPALALAGACAAAAFVLTPAVVADAYAPVSRLLAMASLRAAELAGVASVLLAQTVAVVAFDLTWRSLAVGAALLAAVAAVAVGIEDPAPGQFDEHRVWHQAKVPAQRGSVAHGLSAGESLRRVLEVPAVRQACAANAAYGVLFVPALSFVLLHLDEQRGLIGGWGTLTAGSALLLGALGTWLAGRQATTEFTAQPQRILALGVGAASLCGAALILAVLVPIIGAEGVGIAVAAGLLGFARAVTDAAAISAVPAELRSAAAGLWTACFAVAGATAAPLLLNGMDRRFGPGGAVVVAAFFALQAASALRAIGRTISSDVDRLAHGVADGIEVALVRQRGGHVPLLTCRGLDFSYGQLQVLFGVDFTVDQGEMVALLGTNGAGKSTLLRLISGLALPSTGSVRLDGLDITYLDAERRTRLGISQVPGGRGTYPQLSVVENLRVIGYTAGRDRRRIDEGIDAAFTAFPSLAGRRNQQASTLSGGEQQMLSLSRALLTNPRLLLIDELSLGLAPKVVGELLGFVREINARGTSIVLVEQSVNVALSLVDHAYFMEKGEVRFDGRTDELLDRTDLLRSVFLEGASAAGGVS